MAGLSIAFNSRSPQLDASASLSIQSSDLRDIISSLSPHVEPKR